MKLILTLTAVMVILSIKYSDVNNQKDQDLHKDPLVQSVDQNWYQNAISIIENEEYNISFNETLGAYQSPNRANNSRFIYHKDGFTVITQDENGQRSDVRGQTSDARRETQDSRRETQDARRETRDVRRETQDARRETRDARRET